MGGVFRENGRPFEVEMSMSNSRKSELIYFRAECSDKHANVVDLMMMMMFSLGSPAYPIGYAMRLRKRQLLPALVK